MSDGWYLLNTDRKSCGDVTPEHKYLENGLRHLKFNEKYGVVYVFLTSLGPKSSWHYPLYNRYSERKRSCSAPGLVFFNWSVVDFKSQLCHSSFTIHCFEALANEQLPSDENQPMHFLLGAAHMNRNSWANSSFHSQIRRLAENKVYTFYLSCEDK